MIAFKVGISPEVVPKPLSITQFVPVIQDQRTLNAGKFSSFLREGGIVLNSDRLTAVGIVPAFTNNTVLSNETVQELTTQAAHIMIQGSSKVFLVIWVLGQDLETTLFCSSGAPATTFGSMEPAHEPCCAQTTWLGPPPENNSVVWFPSLQMQLTGERHLHLLDRRRWQVHRVLHLGDRRRGQDQKIGLLEVVDR